MQRLDARGREPGADFWRRARDTALLLGKRAAAQGVERMVFLSSATVHGRRAQDAPLREDAPLAPTGAYAAAKLETERGLAELAAGSRLGLTILRPPLVYGPEVRANFLRLLRLVDRGLPLPLGGVRNMRSVLFIGNLADATAACLAHPNAPGRTFLLADGGPLSTPELVRLMAEALGRRTRLIPAPAPLVRAGFALAGKGRSLGPLLDSFAVDGSRIRAELDWTPPFTTAEGLAETVDWLRQTGG
jgi:nucleoside-diphosphate-sugar epimerase